MFIPPWIALLLNICSAACMAELNALMPNATGGLVQYTLAGLGPLPTLVTMVGGYLICNILCGGVEAAIFGSVMVETIPLAIPAAVYPTIVSIIVAVAALKGVDIFAKLQDFVSYLLLFSMIALGLIGAFQLGTGAVVEQPAALTTDAASVVSAVGVASWLFVGAEYAIPISKDVRNANRNIPLGMMISLALICVMDSLVVLGFWHYVPWGELAESASPHLLYGESLLGNVGKVWMSIVSALAFIGSQNSTVNGLSQICDGMTKVNMMPRFFSRKNRYGAPAVAILFVTISICLIAYFSGGSSAAISFLILVVTVLWLVSYIFADIDVLVLRRRFPKAPRAFKVPGGPVIPVIGIAGTVFMIANISSDPAEAVAIWILAGVTFLVLGVYSFFWIRVQDADARVQAGAHPGGACDGERPLLRDSPPPRHLALGESCEREGCSVGLQRCVLRRHFGAGGRVIAAIAYKRGLPATSTVLARLVSPFRSPHGVLVMPFDLLLDRLPRSPYTQSAMQ